jgi:hypothetical protein
MSDRPRPALAQSSFTILVENGVVSSLLVCWHCAVYDDGQGKRRELCQRRSKMMVLCFPVLERGSGPSPTSLIILRPLLEAFRCDQSAGMSTGRSFRKENLDITLFYMIRTQI